MRWIAVAAVLLAATLAGCGDDDVDAPTGTPVPSATNASPTAEPTTLPSSSPTASPIPGAITLSRGDDIPFPDDMALIVETGCWGCAGGPHTLVRPYRDPSKATRSETILDPASFAVNAYVPGINGLAVNPDASDIAVSLCVRATCGAGGISDWQADSATVILRSTDGGVTWQEVGRGGPALSVVGLLQGGQILTMNYLQPLTQIEFRTYPGNQVVQPPAGSSDYPPITTAAGQPLWRAKDGSLLRSDGSRFIAAREGFRAGWRILGDLTPDKGSFLLSVDISKDGVSSYGLERYEMRGETPSRQDLYVTPQFVIPGWWSPKDELAVVTIDVPPPPEYLGVPVPALLDLSSGEFRLITDPFVPDQRPYQPYGRSRVDAVQIGPFARVVAPGSCLNIRLSPSLTGAVGDCAADGVLLTDTGELREADGVSWVRVRTPAGLDGWAAASYLERRAP